MGEQYYSMALFGYIPERGWNRYFKCIPMLGDYRMIRRKINDAFNDNVVALKLVFDDKMFTGDVLVDPNVLIWENKEHEYYLEYKSDDML